jgi:aminopeptidase
MRQDANVAQQSVGLAHQEGEGVYLQSMNDPRIEAYARLLVERCLNVQPNWQVVIVTTPLARPLVEAAVRLIAGRGAYALVRLNYASISNEWLKYAPIELIGTAAGIDEYSQTHMDAYFGITAPENTQDGSDVAAERQTAFRRSRQHQLKRVLDFTMPWVGCNFPTPALAQDAHMTLAGYEDFLYGACLLDWDALAREMRQRADHFDRADEVHLVGEGTDLRFSIKDRPALVDDGHVNMPGGEFFFSPVEDSAEGVITYAEYPAIYGGNAVQGVRLEFRGGRVAEASAQVNEPFLIQTLDSDPGARVLGELGVGCNPGIQNHMRDVLYDEKINGTIHLALGAGFPIIGGKNTSNVHWDMVKNLRRGGKILLDGVVVQENGAWRI